MSIFEIVMISCFGASWPVSVYKTYKTKTGEGKSLVFLWLIFIGYVGGCLHKIFFDLDAVIILYIFNLLVVFTDLGLSYWYKIVNLRSQLE